MTSIKGHFDGSTVVLDEPATLEIGQAVRIVVESGPAVSESAPAVNGPRKSLAGFAKGMFEMRDDFNEVLREL